MSHEFSHTPQGDVYCARCGYVSYVSDSNYLNNKERQAQIPKVCAFKAEPRLSTSANVECPFVIECKGSHTVTTEDGQTHCRQCGHTWERGIGDC